MRRVKRTFDRLSQWAGRLGYRPGGWAWLALILWFGALFFQRSYLVLDPDFGWHLKTGELIGQAGVPSTDPFSYTMPGFPFIDHEWLTNLLMYRGYQWTGWAGLALVFALLGVLALIVPFSWLPSQTPKEVPLGGFRLALFLLLASSAYSFVGIRPQLLSWLFLALLTPILLEPAYWRTWRWGLPLFFVVWANLHGSFGLGIILLLASKGVRSVWLRKIVFTDLLVLALSVLATFVNPYGPRLWHEFWQQASDHALRWRIVEWLPSFFFFDASFLAVLVLSLVMLWCYRRRFRLEEWLVYGALLSQGLLSVRNVPLFLLIGVPMATKGVAFLLQDASAGSFGLVRVRQANVFVLALGLLLTLYVLSMNLPASLGFTEEKEYPREAVAFLQANPPAGQIFSAYHWGGYLIWHLPGKRVFIDGRMPSWRWSANLPSQSNNAMIDYEAITAGKESYQQLFDRYRVDTVLWTRTDLGDNRLAEWIAAWIKRLLGDRSAGFDLVAELEKANWRQVYRDKISVVYQQVWTK